jgi:hypothetical protein
MKINVSIEFRGVKLDLEGYYTAETPMVMYYEDMSGYPGEPADFELEKILYKDVDVTDIYESFDVIWDIEELAIEKYGRNIEY